eukprot:156387-Pyramimonas_sp.AAC.1
MSVLNPNDDVPLGQPARACLGRKMHLRLTAHVRLCPGAGARTRGSSALRAMPASASPAWRCLRSL